MAEFLIRMADERGQVLEHVEAGHNEAEVRDRFAQQGYLVYSVKPRGLLAGGRIGLGRRQHIRSDQFVIFNSQFLTLIRAGLPILTALDLLIRQQRQPYLRSILENVRDRVRGGESLSEAFYAQGAFPRLYTTTLVAGEKSGNLEEVLGRYIAFERAAMSVRKKLLASLVYPALLVILVILMLTFLVTYVVPRFAELYSNLEAQLPPITAFMLQVGLVIQKRFLAVLAGLLLLAALLWRWKQSDRGAQVLDRVRLNLPLIGGVWLKYQVAIFARMLSTLLSGGLPLVPALETSGGSMQSRLIADGVLHAAQRVREGASLARSLEQSGIFPDLSVEMINVGESTGALPAMLVSVAEFYEEDVQIALTAALSLIEPFILIGMAVVVAFVLVSLYLPIFSLAQGGIIR